MSQDGMAEARRRIREVRESGGIELDLGDLGLAENRPPPFHPRFSHPKIGPRLAQLVRFPLGDRWCLRLRDGVEMLVPA